jgi:hypothetical protein
LGTITSAELVNAGVVQVMLAFDPVTGAIEFRVCKLQR